MSTPPGVAISSPFVSGTDRTDGGVILRATKDGLFEVGCASTPFSGQADSIYHNRADGENNPGAGRRSIKLNDSGLQRRPVIARLRFLLWFEVDPTAGRTLDPAIVQAPFKAKLAGAPRSCALGGAQRPPWKSLLRAGRGGSKSWTFRMKPCSASLPAPMIATVWRSLSIAPSSAKLAK